MDLLEKEDEKYGYHVKRFKITHNCKREVLRQNKTDISRKQDNNNHRRTSPLGVGYWK